jgi:hypothetical protein
MWVAILSCGLVAGPVRAFAQALLPATPYRVGMTQVEYVDPGDGERRLDYMLIYPAAPDAGAAPFKVFLSANLPRAAERLPRHKTTAFRGNSISGTRQIPLY